MKTEHTVKSFDEELQRLSGLIVRMGGVAEVQLSRALQAVTQRNAELAAQIISGDAEVDALERDIDALVLRLLALRQPMASDLREIISALRISADIERMADHAASIAKRAITLSQIPPLKVMESVPGLGRQVQKMLTDVIDAWIHRDRARAMAVWKQDEEVDSLYTSLFRELLTYMMEDPRTITACTHLLFIAKDFERIGDHATNIAELITFLIDGEPLYDRPKSDVSTSAGADPSGKH